MMMSATAADEVQPTVSTTANGKIYHGCTYGQGKTGLTWKTISGRQGIFQLAGHLPWKQYRRSRMAIGCLITLFVICLLFLIVIIVLASRDNYNKDSSFIWHSASEDINISYSPGWLNTSQSFLLSMGLYQNPCEDFYAFACDGWIQLNQPPGNSPFYDVDEKIEQQVSTKLAQILIEGKFPETSEGDFFRSKLQPIYLSCIKNDTAAAAKPFASLIGANGTYPWPVFNWDNKDVLKGFNFVNILAEYAKDYGVDVFFHTKGYTDTTNVLMSFIAKPLLPFGDYTKSFYLSDSEEAVSIRNSYKTLIGHVINEYVATNGGRALLSEQLQAIIDRIVAMETSLASIAAAADSSNDIDSDKEEFAVIDIDELDSTLASEFNWSSYAQTLFPTARKVQIYGLTTMKTLTQFLANSQDRDLLLYTNWRLLQAYLPFVGGNYKRMLNDFYGHILGGYHHSREVECIKFLFDYMSPAMKRLFQQVYPIDPTLQRQVKALTGKVADTIKSLVDEELNLNEHDRKSIFDGIQRMVDSIEVGYDASVININYEDLTVKADQSQFEVARQLLKWCKARQLNDNRTLCQQESNLFGTNFASAYLRFDENQAGPAMVISSGKFLEPLFYNSEQPMSINYGVLGALIGELIARSTVASPWQLHRLTHNNALAKLVEERSRCVGERMGALCFDQQRQACVNGTRTQIASVADIIGVKAAFYSYKHWQQTINNNREEARLPALQRFTAEQLFFLGYARSLCGSYNMPYLRAMLLANEQSPSEFRVIGTLQNSDEFAAAFQCPRQSFMNEKTPCKIW